MVNELRESLRQLNADSIAHEKLIDLVKLIQMRRNSTNMSQRQSLLIQINDLKQQILPTAIRTMQRRARMSQSVPVNNPNWTTISLNGIIDAFTYKLTMHALRRAIWPEDGQIVSLVC